MRFFLGEIWCWPVVKKNSFLKLPTSFGQNTPFFSKNGQKTAIFTKPWGGFAFFGRFFQKKIFSGILLMFHPTKQIFIIRTHIWPSTCIAIFEKISFSEKCGFWSLLGKMGVFSTKSEVGNFIFEIFEFYMPLVFWGMIRWKKPIWTIFSSKCMKHR